MTDSAAAASRDGLTLKKPIIYHIPSCPFSHRIEILLKLKGLGDAVEFHVVDIANSSENHEDVLTDGAPVLFRAVDITKPRDPELLAKTRGTTALPILETEDGKIIKESLVILDYVEERFNQKPIARQDVYERAVERMMIAREEPFAMAGFLLMLNRDRSKTDSLKNTLLEQYAWLGDFLDHHNPGGLWLFDEFGLVELVYTPMLMRVFWFLEYYEEFDLPDEPRFERVKRWQKACIEHSMAQQTCEEEVVKLFYDFAVGAFNGIIPEGRKVSSFTFSPDWRTRPMPPKDKYDRIATDEELGLIEKK